MTTIQQVSRDAIFKTAGVFVNGEGVGLPIAGMQDKFSPLPQVLKQLIERVEMLEAKINQFEKK